MKRAPSKACEPECGLGDVLPDIPPPDLFEPSDCFEIGHIVEGGIE